jgi:hypothetical protein
MDRGMFKRLFEINGIDAIAALPTNVLPQFYRCRRVDTRGQVEFDGDLGDRSTLGGAT